MRDINFDMLELSALIEQLPLRITQLANQADSDFVASVVEADKIIEHRIQASHALHKLLQEIKRGGLDSLETYAKSVGILGRALYGNCDLLLLEHGDLFISAVEKHMPHPDPSNLRDNIFRKILNMENESLDATLKRQAFISEMKDMKQRFISAVSEMDEEDFDEEDEDDESER